MNRLAVKERKIRNAKKAEAWAAERRLQLDKIVICRTPEEIAESLGLPVSSVVRAWEHAYGQDMCGKLK